MERTINSFKEGDKDVMVYYNSKYLFSKLKYRIENDESNSACLGLCPLQKIKIKEPINIKLEVVDLEIVE
jgi:hypothetical protein